MFKLRVIEKIFFLIIATIVSICIIIAIIVRLSITQFTYEDIFNKVEEFSYQPYEYIEYSNGTFIDGSVINKIDNYNDYILKGKVTGKREIAYGSVITEIEIIEQFKGNIKSKIINIYEPFDIMTYGSYHILTYGGYNLAKNNKEYIFCLNSTEKENNYIYSSPFKGKFPIEYNQNDFKILVNNKEAMYSDCVNYEQVFENEFEKEKYFKEYEYLYNKYISKKQSV